VSQRDDEWTREIYAKLFPGKDPAKIGIQEFATTLGRLEASLPDQPPERPFAGLTRQEDGTFDDDDLVKILADSIEDVAGAFGARHVPLSLRPIEILGIGQARSWNLASLNEFRKFFNLAPHKTFEDINPDPEVADQLRHLYDHPDFVELYPGIAVEEAKPEMVPGSGLCTTYTISRAVLSDAVALVRGDRFYTVCSTSPPPKDSHTRHYADIHYPGRLHPEKPHELGIL
jgi:linoleate 8R-lipoxygenase / 9,12-octadecadienoate 8-hydroperoxide 8R-isomerase